MGISSTDTSIHVACDESTTSVRQACSESARNMTTRTNPTSEPLQAPASTTARCTHCWPTWQRTPTVHAGASLGARLWSQRIHAAALHNSKSHGRRSNGCPMLPWWTLATGAHRGAALRRVSRRLRDAWLSDVRRLAVLRTQLSHNDCLKIWDGVGVF